MTIQSLLLANGITKLEINYSGYGDSGQIESIEPELPTDVDTGLFYTDWEGNTHPKTLRHLVEDKFYPLLSTHFGGWEINEGSQGTIIWDVTNDKVTIQHEWNVISISEETWES